jgi:hypothetical protein
MMIARQKSCNSRNLKKGLIKLIFQIEIEENTELLVINKRHQVRQLGKKFSMVSSIKRKAVETALSLWHKFLNQLTN